MSKDSVPVVPAENTAASVADKTRIGTGVSIDNLVQAVGSDNRHSSSALVRDHGRSRGYSASAGTAAALARPDMHRGISGSSSTGNSGPQLVPDTPLDSSSNSSPMSDLQRNGKRFIGCSAFEDYELLTKLGEGTFGEVHKAVHKAAGSVVALKRVLMHNEKEGLPITAIREIKLLKSLRHPNIVPLSDMLVRHEPQGSGAVPSVYMVFPYMDHDLTGLLENPKIQLRPEHIKLYLRQLLEGTAYLHASRVMHRDMKASNLLLNNEGRLYIADFGLARSFNPDDKKDMTKCVVTRWYRPPELLLGERRYTTAIDMWGIGCIFAEMLVGKPVFQGSTDISQIDHVMRICGSPTAALWPTWRDLPDCKQVEEFATYPRRVREEFARFGDDAADLLDQLLQLDPRRRPDAATALKHRLFFTAPFPARPEDMPKFEHSHEFDRRRSRHQQRAQQGQNAAGHQQGQPTSNHARQRYSGQHQMQYSPTNNRRDSGRYARRDDGNVRRDEPYGQRGDPRRSNYGHAARNSGYHPYPRGAGNAGPGRTGDSGWK
ncbi:serine/threonine protein kinase, CMGC, CDC2/CDK sub [Coemansia erecta]|uniref:Serine/threonine protein kinase, CMGC, CDC2/CDK sub n=1 Tax=Coemansia asiatica TaxID=1052880 RepID=A0A9W7XS79_9FUNG|nr:serine/threonine protein kinase, CMGC, CDC2/CDK sub [Coemansia asiatica]KAJ2858578.1 serine/threonine protein kinase, CMGC, CDC2/CDK sub [Coemansia erecta]KAJ2889240.1 serine/threonine protein kinase, CMGC, CDC2/CDK sub [Coemansia asiatica]